MLLSHEELGPERSGKIETATSDMSQAYVTALKERAPRVQIVFDRFHVQRLAGDAVDQVRRKQVREAKGADRAA